MRVYALKTHASVFQAVLDLRKLAEWRDISDWPQEPEVGDVLSLVEVADRDGASVVTGRMCLRRVTHVSLGGHFGLPEGFAVLSMRPVLEST